MNSKKCKTLRRYAGAVAERQGLPKVLSTTTTRSVLNPQTGQVNDLPGTFSYRDCEKRLYRDMKREYRKGNLQVTETAKG